MMFTGWDQSFIVFYLFIMGVLLFLLAAFTSIFVYELRKLRRMKKEVKP